MKNIKHTLRRTVAVAIIAGVGLASPAVTTAAPPAGTKIIGAYALGQDHGAYVRILGDPGDGTLRFQYGWNKGTDASDDAIGYWLGIYDVTNSRYYWPAAPDSPESGYDPDLPEQFFRNGPILPKLPNGQYKVNFFVRNYYDDPSNEFDETTNVSVIEVPFTVDYMGG